MKKKTKAPIIMNLVAKYAHEFNRSATFKDKTKFVRGTKHKNKSFVDFNYVLVYSI